MHASGRSRLCSKTLRSPFRPCGTRMGWHDVSRASRVILLLGVLLYVGLVRAVAVQASVFLVLGCPLIGFGFDDSAKFTEPTARQFASQQGGERWSRINREIAPPYIRTFGCSASKLQMRGVRARHLEYRPVPCGGRPSLRDRPCFPLQNFLEKLAAILSKRIAQCNLSCYNP